MILKRTNHSTGAKLEAMVGYSRMVKVGPFISLGGTTSVQPDDTVYGIDSPYEQTKYILDKLVKLLQEVDARVEDVTKVKIYTTDMAYAPDIAKAFTEVFFEVKPLLTVVGILMLNRPTQLVEIEMEAILSQV